MNSAKSESIGILETATGSAAEMPVRPPLERIAGRLVSLRFAPLLGCLTLAAVLALLGGWIAVKISREYYTIAPYHFDSAYYRLQSVMFYQMRETQGLAPALLKSMQSKDALDISLRLVAAPGSLLSAYGHMVILLPFMALFLFLVAWYVFRNTGSFLFSVVSMAFLFTLPLIYAPYGAPTIGGIADYWKDNLAIWMFGDAVLCWLLADHLARRGWAALCGLLLGLVVMQRAVIAVYAAMLFLPLVAYACYRRLRADSLRAALAAFAALAAPAGLLALAVIIPQWRSLYRYYFQIGYDYGSPLLVGAFLLNNLKAPTVIPVLVFFAACAGLCVARIKFWRRQRAAITTALWLVLMLPVMVMASSAFYPGFFPMWSLLLLALLGTLLPYTPNTQHRRLLAAGLLVLTVVATAVQYTTSTQLAVHLANRKSPDRLLYNRLINLINAQQAPRRYGLVFREVDVLMRAQAFFDRQLWLSPSVVAVSAHDSVYRTLYPGRSAEQIADQNIRTLEAQAGTLALGLCRPDDILNQPGFSARDNPFTTQTIRLTSQSLRNRQHWREIKRIDSPYGQVCAYIFGGR